MSLGTILLIILVLLLIGALPSGHWEARELGRPSALGPRNDACQTPARMPRSFWNRRLAPGEIRFLPIATEVSPFREKKKPFRRAQETGALNGDDISAC